VKAAGGDKLGVFPATMTGADVVAQVGVARGTNLTHIGAETAILVVASDLEEEAPIWFLRAKRAADRGARLIVLNARKTKLEKYAKCVLHYGTGEAVEALNHLLGAVMEAGGVADSAVARAEGGADFLKKAKFGKINAGFHAAAQLLLGCENLIIFMGAEGLTLETHDDAMQAAANLLILTGRVGRADNGLIPVWPGANTQGAFDLGYRAEATAEALRQKVVIMAGCDPLGTDPMAAEALQGARFRVAVSLFPTASTESADLVLPRQSVPERDGTFTNGERRVQRFYTAQGFLGETRPDWKIFAETHKRLDATYAVKFSAGAVMTDITKHVPAYAEMNYKALAQGARQFPDVGGEDLYYGGTAYANKGGLGLQWAVEAEKPEAKLRVKAVKPTKAPKGLLAVPVRVLYDRSPEFFASTLMHQRIPAPYAELNSADAKKLGVQEGDLITLRFGEHSAQVVARVDGKAPQGTVLVPMNLSQAPLPTALTPVAVEK
jgi:NADH-quinone oxidoreductase subunit G